MSITSQTDWMCTTYIQLMSRWQEFYWIFKEKNEYQIFKVTNTSRLDVNLITWHSLCNFVFDWYVVNKPLILYETGQFKQQNVPFRKKNISLTNYSSVQATECILKKNNSQLSVIAMPQVDLIW